MKLTFTSIILLFSLIGISQQNYPFKNPDLPTSDRVIDILNRLTIEEKVALLQSTAEAIPRLGIENYYHGNEGLHGVVKGGRFTVFPQAIALAATWNPKLIKEVATTISDEARAKWNFFDQGKNQMNLYSDMLTFWSPTINMARDPRWGRTPETYGEDPFLTSNIGLAFVQGLQGDDDRYIKVVATPKHFVANNQEENRFAYNAKISEKALREYYFPAFKTAVVEGKAQAVMSAYNAINGIPSTANAWLLNKVLRKEWGFKGYVVSDCGAVKNVEESHEYASDKEQAAKVTLEAGLDLECGKEVYPHHLLPAYKKGLVSKMAIDTAVARVLRARFHLGIFDPVENNPYTKISPEVIGSQKHQNLALETARQSIVLLKNQDNTLPLDASKIKKIAVIGNNASKVVFGDYSGLPVIRPISPLQGITKKVGSTIDIVPVRWKTGPLNLDLIEAEYLQNDNTNENGLFAEYFDNKLLEGTPRTRVDEIVDFDPVNYPPDVYTSAQYKSIRWTGYITPNISGTYQIGVNSDDGVRLWVDDELVIDEWYNRGATTDQIKIDLVDGKQHSIKLEYYDNGGDAICQLLWKTPNNEFNMYNEDRKLVSESDWVIAVLGTNKSIEKEGRDRKSIALPEDQIAYLKEMYAINKNMVVVLVAGSSLAINWIDDNIPAVLDAWYPGESGGTAIADVLFGDFNPAGRLPLTFYKSLEDLPSMDDYEVENGRTYMYFEGDPLYPFGHGLSYSKFEYNAMELSKSDETVTISMNIKNTGNQSGDEVVQLYYRQVDAKTKRPLKKLVGFERRTLDVRQSKTLVFKVPFEELQFWNQNTGKWEFQEGTYELMLGASSEDIRLKKSIVLEK
ncbi:MAG: glycoside hydrolase family 3 C-terminal domain-containing protein [Bacteroidota bacterium]